MVTFIKLTGVKEEDIGKIHKAIKEVKSNPNVAYGICTKKSKHIEILDSKFDKKHGTFTVSLKINWKILCCVRWSDKSSGDGTFEFYSYLLMSDFANVFKCVDENILCEDEKNVPVDQESAKKMLEHYRHSRSEECQAEVLKILAVFVGKKLDYPVVNREKGEVIVSDVKKITSLPLDLSPFTCGQNPEFFYYCGSDKEVKSALQKIITIYVYFKEDVDDYKRLIMN